MPEIKATFTGGKMNQDLDERLIPNGQYREALNIQVSTSEGSDVGSVQNILGNTSLESIITEASYRCVGSISDERNNRLFWFITNDTNSAIIEYDIDASSETPILVDLGNDVLEFSVGNQITGINVVDDFLFWTDGENEPKKINIENFRANTHGDLTVHSDMYVNGTSVGAVEKEHITVIKKRPTQAPTMDLTYVGQGSSSSGVLSAAIDFSGYSAGDTVALTFTLNTFIVQVSGTGLIGDYTDVSGAVTTAGMLGTDLYDALEYDFEEDAVLLLSDPASVGVLPNNVQVRMLITDNSTSTSKSVDTNGVDIFVQTITIKISSIDSDTPAGSIIYNFQVEDLDDLLFNKSFPRFSYRYKYEDGEYSAFGPFTQVGFSAGEFSIHPTREPYNSAMENRVKEIKLREFVTYDIPDGVVEIDLLYKPDNSTNIYSIDTVKPKLANGNDNKEWTLYDKNGTTDIAGPTLPDGSTPTASSTGCYIIKTENIYAALPSNQLLRPWDNVPKKAQAQDFTANRLVYGNYTQNLSLGSYDNKFTLRSEERDFADETISFEKGQPSIKSQRTYQSGIVFGDEYGRETPVFTGGKNSSTKIIYDRSPDSATFNGNASRSNRFYFKNLASVDAKANWDNNNSLEPYYFKVFIKETASEYYNLVMDRVYRAEEDGNLWISFPSSDRNKLQEDDYIVLKKALESDAQVGIENKFKVIDIKNEAPEFIRKKYQEIGQADGDGTLSDLYANGALQPYAGSSKILLSKESLIDENINDLQSIFDKGEKISITFSKTNNSYEEMYSKRYHIISLTTTGSSPEFYNITFDKNIVQQDSWVESSAGVLEPTLKTNIWKESTQEWEEFQGRFFVKIISDIVTDQYLEPQIGTSVQSNMVARAELFYLGDSALLAYNSGQHSTNKGSSNTGYDLSNATDRVTNNLKFGESATTSNWFIDSVYTVSQQPTIKASTSADSGSLSSDGWSYNSDYGSLSPEMGSLDVSTSGNLFSDGSRFGGKVDGVEGIIVTSDKFHSTGARMWRKQPGGSYADDGDPDVYGSTNGKFYMHLSFSGVGTDLMDGVVGLDVTSTSSGSNINPSEIDLGSIINYNQQDSTLTGDQKTLDYTQSNTITNVDASANQWNPLYNHPENEDIIKNLTTGSKFKFNNDTNNTLFTIRSVTVKRLYNYVSWNRYNVVDPGDDTAVIEGESSVNFAYQAFVDSWSGSSSGNGDAVKWGEVEDMVRDFAAPINRRVCYILELDKNPIAECSINPETLVKDASTFLNFQQNYVSENSTVLSDNPAVWETEPRDTSDLDIYYEASNAIPIRLDINSASSASGGYDAPDNRKGHMIAPIGSAVRCSKVDSHASTPGYKDCVVESWDGNIITLNPGLNVDIDFEIPDSAVPPNDPGDAGYTATYAATNEAGQTLAFSAATLKLYRDDLSYVEVGIYNVPTDGITGGIITKFSLDRTVNRKIGLPYFNCFSFGNGVESNRIRDDFNKPFISNGVKASSTLQEQYLEDHRSSGLIYSGLYSKNSSLNSLNQFIMAEKITKDLLPTYGSIQKLFARDSDLIALCEDKIVQIFADKDALFNADGNPQLVATNKVLGQSRPFVGEYGISKNPESFASSSYRAYFTDKQRGAVLRLSMDGLTPISDAGMHDWFADKMKGSYSSGKIIGSYDTNKDNYNLTFDYGVSENNGSYSFDADADFKSTTTDVTVTYKEDVKGWVSFKSFIPESGLSAVDTYFTFRNGKLYRHDDETRNTFYGDKKDSFITAIFNDSPTTIKHFNTLNYDGMSGWTCDKIITDIEESTIDQFINKENKYFATIVGDDDTDDTSSFNFQGIGIAESIN